MRLQADALAAQRQVMGQHFLQRQPALRRMPTSLQQRQVDIVAGRVQARND